MHAHVHAWQRAGQTYRVRARSLARTSTLVEEQDAHVPLRRYLRSCVRFIGVARVRVRACVCVYRRVCARVCMHVSLYTHVRLGVCSMAYMVMASMVMDNVVMAYIGMAYVCSWDLCSYGLPM